MKPGGWISAVSHYSWGLTLPGDVAEWSETEWSEVRKGLRAVKREKNSGYR